MSMLRKIVALAVISLFLTSIFVGCVSEKTRWDPDKETYVPVEEPARK